MPASIANPSHAQTRLTAGIVARCAGVALASAPLAWLCAALLSHRTLPEHEKIATIALTVLAVGAAIHYSRLSWTWSGLFLSVSLLVPSVLDHRCLLLGSLAAPILTALVLSWRAPQRAFVVVLASLEMGAAAALGASLLLTPWPGSVNKLAANAWDVQWSMWGEQGRLAQARGAWERAIGSANIKELEAQAQRELELIRTTEREARQKEFEDYFAEAIPLYRWALEQLRQTQQLVARAQSWESASAPGERNLVRQYENAALTRADALAAQALADRAAHRIEAATHEYEQAAEAIKTVHASAANKAERVAAARRSWEAARTGTDGPLLSQYAKAAVEQAKGKEQDAAAKDLAGDADNAVRLYEQARTILETAAAVARLAAVQVKSAQAAWQSAIIAADLKAMEKYANTELTLARGKAQEADSKDRSGDAEIAGRLYGEGVDLLKHADAAARQKASQIAGARKSWDGVMSGVDPKALTKYAGKELAQAKGKAQEAESRDHTGDGENAARLYAEATDLLKHADAAAKQAIQEIDWQKANAGGTVTSLITYLVKHSDSQSVQRATVPPDILAGLTAYVTQHPEGAHSSEAMFDIGFLYEFGKGVTRDGSVAMQWYKKAAEATNVDAMARIGMLYCFGHGGVTQDYQQAMMWSRKAANAGNALAMADIGFLYDHGYGVTQDYQLAMQWYKRAVDGGDAQAVNNIGFLYYSGHGVTQDYQQAMQWYKRAVDGGVATAMNNIGILYDNGYGVTQDYQQAMQWYKRAVEGGNAQAMNNIGFLYHNGHGVPQDYQQAIRWYKKAIDGGDAMAMNNIGFLYDHGYGVTQDYQQAMQWYKRAAEGGNAQAMNNIGFLYHNGHGMPQDYQQAMQWYKRAVDGGDATAMNNIGFLYENGLGVPKDARQAAEWYRKAAALGNPNAQQALRRLGLSG